MLGNYFNELMRSDPKRLLTNATAPSVIRIRLEGLRGLDLAFLIKKIWPKVEAQVKQGAMVSVTGSGIRIRNMPLFAT